MEFQVAFAFSWDFSHFQGLGLLDLLINSKDETILSKFYFSFLLSHTILKIPLFYMEVMWGSVISSKLFDVVTQGSIY